MIYFAIMQIPALCVISPKYPEAGFVELALQFKQKKKIHRSRTSCDVTFSLLSPSWLKKGSQSFSAKENLKEVLQKFHIDGAVVARPGLRVDLIVLSVTGNTIFGDPGENVRGRRKIKWTKSLQTKCRCTSFWSQRFRRLSSAFRPMTCPYVLEDGVTRYRSM